MSETRESIGEFFGKDHDVLDSILAQVAFTDAKEALPRMREFDRRLERHIVWEEEILFPALARVAPQLEPGPIAVMKQEHREIRAFKREALEALERRDGAAAHRAVERMTGVLRAHNSKEEGILYPACDRLLDDHMVRSVLAAVRMGAPA